MSSIQKKSENTAVHFYQFKFNNLAQRLRYTLQTFSHRCEACQTVSVPLWAGCTSEAKRHMGYSSDTIMPQLWESFNSKVCVTICTLSKIERVRDVSLCLLHASTQGRLWSIIRDSLGPLWMRISVFAGSAMLTLFNYWIVCVRGALAGAFVYQNSVYTASPQQNNLLESHLSLIIWLKFLNGFS